MEIRGVVPVVMTALALATSGASVPIEAQSADVSASAHVRTTDSTIAQLLRTGMARSPTLERIVTSLDPTDVIVYIEPQQRHLERYAGYLVHDVLERGAYRYLRIMLRLAGREDALIGSLSHELMHAVEVAESRDTRDAASVGRLFARIGIHGACMGVGSCRETRRAIQTQRAVLRELARPASTDAPTPATGLAESLVPRRQKPPVDAAP